MIPKSMPTGSSSLKSVTHHHVELDKNKPGYILIEGIG